MREAGFDAGSIAGELAPERDPAELEESWFGSRALPLFERLSGEVTSARPRRWDAVVSAQATDIEGDELGFVGLRDGSLIVDQEGEADLTPLAEAVESQIEAPYRAQGVRRGPDVWAVAARKIQVATFKADGEEITLSEHGDGRTLTVDGAVAFGSVPELERIGRAEGHSYVVRAQRLDGDVWEVLADPL
jgi:hypothetical protein